MSKFYQGLDKAGGFDYELFNLPTLGWRTFRGPPIDTSKPYLAFVGAAQTFGRFVTDPFPTILGRRLDIPVLNLGVGGSGPRHFRERAYLDVINGAEAVVLQVLSGRSASNSQFDNTKSGGHAGQRSSDGSTLRSEEFFRQLTVSSTLEEIKVIVQETRADYTNVFIDFIRQISVPKILFWLSGRNPDYDDDYSDLPFSLFQTVPQLVNEQMVKEVAAFSDDYVECISTNGLPQKLWQADSSIDGAVLRNGILENNYYPSPEMHVQAADALEVACRKYTGRYKKQQSDPARFVVVAAERTGTNLLIGMLKDYEDCRCGFELFNPVNLEKDIIPWDGILDEERPELLALRKRDPVSFWKTLCDRSEAEGYHATGFKLLYGHGFLQDRLLQELISDETVMIIHLVRRNLLRRVVSEQQAKLSGKWAEGWLSPVIQREPVALTLEEIVSSFQQVERHQLHFDMAFANHRILKIFYEDLAANPTRVAERAAQFLGLRKLDNPARVKFRKTGAEKLEDALDGLDTLKAHMRRWASFFD